MQIEERERRILNEVKFINYMLEECRRRNKRLQNDFGMSYGKFVGVGTVYEEAIHAMRKVKSELDTYLRAIRDNLSGGARRAD